MSGLSRARRARLARRCTTSTRSGCEVVGGLAAPHARAAGLRRRARRSPTTSTVRSTAPTSCSSRSASAARRRGSRDETLPLACGCIGQETTGAGGLAKALRTVPVVLEIAERVRELAAPDAWIVDFTNPVGIVTRALLDARPSRRRALQRRDHASSAAARRLLGVEPDRVVVDQVGLNHLTWVRAVRLDGATCCPSCSPSTATRSRPRSGCRARLLRRARRGALLLPPLLLRARRGLARAARRRRRAPQRWPQIERELLELYRDPALTEKPALLEQRGGAYYSEAATGLVASLVSGRRRSARGGHAQRRRRWPGSPPTTSSRCRRASAQDGPEPLEQAPLAPELLGARPARRRVRAARGARRRSTRDAGRRDRKALLAHPLDRPVGADRGAVRAHVRERARGGAMSVSLSRSPSTAATRRPTSRSSTRGRRGARAPPRPGQLAAPPRPRRGRWTCSRTLVVEAAAGLDGDVAEVARALLAGVDFPVEEQEAAGGVGGARLGATRARSRNDTFAVLRAGTERGWGVAVTCGAGINCVGVAPDGRTARFPALGELTGDWGGGRDVGFAALAAAARSEDGRGPKTQPRAPRPRAFRRRHAARARGGHPPAPHPARAASSSWRRSSSPRPTAIPSPARSSTGSAPRSSRSPARRSSGWR